ncbi:MAG: histidine kinase [Actinomycetota bacterium]|nr:histidine kinase [Actinomycetota bacterium]
MPDLSGLATTIVTVVAIAALAGGLRWRKRHSFLLALAAVAIVVVQDALGGRATQADAVLLAYLLFAYSVGAHSQRRIAVIGLAALIGGLFADEVLSPDAGTFSAVSPLVTCIPAWFVGRVLRVRRDLSRQLVDRAGELESEREQLAELAVAAERARIARELHDVVAHSVSLMVIQAAAGQRVVNADADAGAGAFDAILDAGEQASAELTRLVGLLDSVAADTATSEPGLARLDELVRHAEQNRMQITLNVKGGQMLPASVDAAAFRIVQEAITNAVKHAGPGKLTVSVEHVHGQLELGILDEGRTAPDVASPASGGHGLQGMRERVELLDGKLEAGPRADGGWALRATLPLGQLAAISAGPQHSSP